VLEKKGRERVATPRQMTDTPSFAAFLRDKASLWTGLSNTEYADVERHHALAAQPGLEVDVEPVSPTGHPERDDGTDQSRGGKAGTGPGAESESGELLDRLGLRAVDKGSTQSQAQPLAATQSHGGSGTTVKEDNVKSGVTDIEGAKVEGYPDFGRNMRQYWSFGDNSTYTLPITPSPRHDTAPSSHRLFN
jgi:hypothetical protein